MSGKKRALVSLGSQAAARLDSLEALMGRVQADYQLVQGRIAAIHVEEETRAQAMQAARQQALCEAMSGVDRRFQQLELQAARALASQEQEIQHHAQRLEGEVQRTHTGLAALAYQLEQQRLATQDCWRSAQELLDAAQALANGLWAYYPSALWKTANPRISAWIEEAGANLYRGQAEAALVAAQEAYLDLQDLRLFMESQIQRSYQMRMTAIQRLNEILVLVESNTGVQAVDQNGQFLNTWIDVNRWSGGKLSKVHARTVSILQQINNQLSDRPDLDWREILEVQIPRLEQSVSDAVQQARRTVLLTQIRFNIAEHIIAALAEQGFTLSQSGWLDQPPQTYQAALADYSGNQVQVSILPPDAGSAIESLDQACQLDLQYHCAGALSEHILTCSVDEVFQSLRRAGLKVAAQPAPNARQPGQQSPLRLVTQSNLALQAINS